MNTTPFHNVRFPTQISRHATGGPERKVDIVTLGSGHEERNARWAFSRRRYKIGFGVKSLDDLYRVLDFFEERRGPLHAFRFKDPLDFQSCPPLKTPSAKDQLLGHANGTSDTLALFKTYGSAFNPLNRPITKPIPESVKIAFNGLEISQNRFSVDDLTGAILFKTPPPENTIITAGFAFDLPVRFENTSLEIDFDAFTAGSIPDISLLEVRE